jgi:catechol 2,3-dioxygenase-like lactoylglutathione lyase family enzyme
MEFLFPARFDDRECRFETEVPMLNSKDVTATIAVKNLDEARKFYENKLGFKQTATDNANYINYKSGDTNLLVYKSQFAGGYKATVATWKVGKDIEKVANTLKNAGVTFEHYDFPGVKREGDIHIMGDMKNAWCKDPDGNILGFVNA